MSACTPAIFLVGLHEEHDPDDDSWVSSQMIPSVTIDGVEIWRGDPIGYTRGDPVDLAKEQFARALQRALANPGGRVVKRYEVEYETGPFSGRCVAEFRWRWVARRFARRVYIAGGVLSIWDRRRAQRVKAF